MSRIGSTDPISIVKQYYSNPDIIRSYITVRLFPSETKIIDKFFKPGSTVLDIGCGAGRTTIALAKKGYEVTGIDIIPEMIEAAKLQAIHHNVNVNFKVMDAVNMDFPDESFQNAFFSFNGFEHIPGKKNRKEVLKKVFNILKPGGCFVLTARSGLAFGRRWIGWIWIITEFFSQRLINGKKMKFELGDKVWRGQYHHYIIPFLFKTLLKDVGYKILYFNSDKNVLKDKEANFLTNISNDRMLFYVLSKN